MARRAVLAAVCALIAFASPAGAGTIGAVVEAPTGGALAVAVSQAYFPAGSAQGVVVTDPDRPGVAAIAAAFAGGAAGRVPVLFVGDGVSDGAVRSEIARATSGADPTVWLAGASLDGLSGYDVRDLGATAAEVSASVIGSGPASGTGNRVLIFDEADWRAGAVAAGFGAAYGLPLLPAAAVPAGLGSTPEPIGIVIGDSSVPADRFSRVDRIQGASPTAMSIAVADALFAKEFPAGAPVGVPVPLQPVSADGYGTNPAPALLAAVASAALQAEGARAPVLLVDARPTPDLPGGCAAGPKDAAALCLMAKSDGATTVLALAAVGRSDAVPAGVGLPATGGVGFPVLAAVLTAAVLIWQRRTRATLAREQGTERRL